MNVSTRAALAAGVVAVTGGALVFTPSVLPATMRTIEVVAPVAFSGDSNATTPASVEPATTGPAEVRAALELIGRLDPAPEIRRDTLAPGGGSPASPDTSADARDSDRALADPEAQNAASDLINGVYSISRYWANYVSLELGPWLINWIPFGYLISDQIYIWYPDFVLPVVDSFVYDFLDPVVNDPLNLSVWVNGIGRIIDTALTGVYNGIVGEVQYVLSGGWFPFPLPPLPNFPLPSAADSASTTVALAGTEAADEQTDAAGEPAAQPGSAPGSTAETDPQDVDGTTEESSHDGAEGTTEGAEGSTEGAEGSTEGADQEADEEAGTDASGEAGEDTGEQAEYTADGQPGLDARSGDTGPAGGQDDGGTAAAADEAGQP
ncbi:hypothetical protein ACNUDN_17830 [Mycobacterium sp. smrl_JER01]|uniref:hypothetical protein n=1 Tax=Mycobacterium sp. smrl_JER01 TaxID=3402633 RepID=UPI003AC9D548